MGIITSRKVFCDKQGRYLFQIFKTGLIVPGMLIILNQLQYQTHQEKTQAYAGILWVRISAKTLQAKCDFSFIFISRIQLSDSTMHL